jgi:hypothetical protein
MRFGRAGGVSTGNYWELATRTDGKFHIGNNADCNVGLCIDTAGNIGIGNVAPATKLDVTGSIKLSGTSPSLYFPDNYGALGYASSGGAYSASAGVGDLVLRSGAGYKLILQSGGGGGSIIIGSDNNVGITGNLSGGNVAKRIYYGGAPLTPSYNGIYLVDVYVTSWLGDGAGGVRCFKLHYYSPAQAVSNTNFVFGNFDIIYDEINGLCRYNTIYSNNSSIDISYLPGSKYVRITYPTSTTIVVNLLPFNLV